MNFQHMEAYCGAGEASLACCGLEKDCVLRLMHCPKSATFLMAEKSGDRARGVMRVSRSGYHTLAGTEAEVRWLGQIVVEGTAVIPRPIRCLDGQAVARVQARGQEYHLVLSEYLEGEASDPEHGGRGFPWSRKIGETAARLHRRTMEWKESRDLRRPVWDWEAVLGVDGLFGNWRLCRGITGEEKAVLEETCEEIKRHLMWYGRMEQNFGLIYSDLRVANLLVKGEMLKVLDFDNCGFGWYFFDLAASFSFIEDRPEIARWTEERLEGYTGVLELGWRNYEMIPTFLTVRRIQLLAWTTSHDDSEPVRVYKKGFTESTLRMTGEYLGKNGG